MKEQFVPISIAEILKQKGFDELCMAYVYTGDTGNNVDRYVYGPISPEGIVVQDDWNKYDMSYSLPLWQHVLQWLREKHNIDISIEPGGKPKMYAVFVSGNWIYENSKDRMLYSYNEARQAAIEHALTLI